MLKKASRQAQQIIDQTIENTSVELKVSQSSVIHSISSGTAEVLGLSDVKMNELLSFKNNIMGVVQTLQKDPVSAHIL